ncbi:MAG TPA: DUF2924 domain-containing protein [Candidatus Sulfotelmatobacter sp.]|nr:DUF2924 domain-containing protein [Candidatus Sulfotelmatobacter sp.]
MTKTDSALVDEIEKLRTLPVADLRIRYQELFGEETTSRNKDYLFKRIAYRLQEKKYGGLTPRARARAELLAEDAPIRRRLSAVTDAPEFVRQPPENRDRRLPPAGTELRRTFDGAEHIVTVLDAGFMFRGKQYRSLSLIAREITGTRWNGYGFFGLLQKESA